MRLIDADAFKKILSEYEMEHDKRRSFDDYAWGASNAYEHASDLLDEMPTVERPHGEWIEKTGIRPPEDKGVKFCSNCMNRQPRDLITHKPIEPDFCPICGSDNRKSGETE